MTNYILHHAKIKYGINAYCTIPNKVPIMLLCSTRYKREIISFNCVIDLVYLKSSDVYLNVDGQADKLVDGQSKTAKFPLIWF